MSVCRDIESACVYREKESVYIDIERECVSVQSQSRNIATFFENVGHYRLILRVIKV